MLIQVVPFFVLLLLAVGIVIQVVQAFLCIITTGCRNCDSGTLNSEIFMMFLLMRKLGWLNDHINYNLHFEWLCPICL